jgi:queuosine precursor transporter
MIAYIILSLVFATCLCWIGGRRHAWIPQIGYAAAVSAGFITAAKLAPVVDGVFVSASIGLYSATFLLTDYLDEVFGKQQALRAVYMGIIAECVVLFAVLMTLAVPSAPFWPHQEAWSTTFGVVPRIMIASISAFVISQLLDVYLFDWLKRKHQGRLLFVRNNVATILSQTVDTLIFYSIAFWGVAGVELGELILMACLVKYVIALLDTPFIYAVCIRAKRQREAGAVESD